MILTLTMLYLLNIPPDCPLSRCSRIVLCSSCSTVINSLSSGKRSIKSVHGIPPDKPEQTPPTIF